MFEKYKENTSDETNMAKALESCYKSFEYYEKINHKYGQAQSLLL